MRIDSTLVAFLPCRQYLRKEIADAVDTLCGALQFRVAAGTRILLKPNLLSARSAGHLACTHPEFVAAVAEWFVDHGARVAVGDSPAFGTAQGVMRSTGIEKALAGLPVECINFGHAIPVRLAGGVTVKVAVAALECDMLVNLPRVKVHSQLYVTLAVKNYFGTVVGFQKPMWHLRYGSHEDRFASHLVDLLGVLPGGISLVDGIVAMHGAGPIGGDPYPLGLVGASCNPIALDSGLLRVLEIEPGKSPVWQECARRSLPGSDTDSLIFPMAAPEDFSPQGFRGPAILKPVSFNPLRMLISGGRRFAARLKEST